MSRKYGPIMGVKLLGNFTVILSSHEAIREAFVKHGYDFAGRPSNAVLHAFSCDTGKVICAYLFRKKSFCCNVCFLASRPSKN